MGKTRDLFKEIRDTKGIFHAKMGSVKDRNGMDLTEAEDIKKRWQEYTEELYKKDLNDSDNHHGVVTNLEPDILECEVKWALGSKLVTMLNDYIIIIQSPQTVFFYFSISHFSNKASGGDGIPLELFQILKDGYCESVALNMPANLENSAVATELEKVSFYSNPKETQCQRMLNAMLC